MESTRYKIGHRGIPALHAENTMDSFHAAVEYGANGLEFDVRTTKDGVPVILHDDDLNRTTPLKGAVADAHWNDVKKHIPSLGEVLQAFYGKALLLIEVKSVDATLPTCELLKKYAAESLYEQLVIISFEADILRAVKDYDFHIPVGLSFKQPIDIEEAQLDLRLSAINPQVDIVTPAMTALATELELDVFVWTANTINQIKHAKKCHATGIMTDDVRMLKE